MPAAPETTWPAPDPVWGPMVRVTVGSWSHQACALADLPIVPLDPREDASFATHVPELVTVLLDTPKPTYLTREALTALLRRGPEAVRAEIAAYELARMP